eukprot:m.309065 g.309065  ORF g.309065 m.309065 type:complete len:333 (+) comp45415_c0_seq1:67-1065(+)
MGNCCSCCCVNPEEDSESFLKDRKPDKANTPPVQNYGSVDSTPPVSPSEVALGPSDTSKPTKVDDDLTNERDSNSSKAEKPEIATADVARAQEVSIAVVPSTVEEGDDDADPKETLLKKASEKMTVTATARLAAGGQSPAKKKFVVSVLLLGPTGVGKSCLIDRMIFGNEYKFEEEKKATAGTRLSRCTVELPDFMTEFKTPPLQVSVWDVGGLAMSPSVLKTTLRNKDGVFLVYSRSDASSAEQLGGRVPSVLELVKAEQQVALLGNKSDDVEGEGLEENLGPLLEIVKEKEMKHFVVSAKEGGDVQSLFFQVCFDAACRKYGESALKEAA